MTITVTTTQQDGSDPRNLGQYGQVLNWKHTKNFPGGCTSATFDYNAPPDVDNPALRAGRMLTAYSGTAPVFVGRLEQPTPGYPWSCTVTGNAALAKDYQAHNSVGNVYSVNATIDQAIVDGLPWTRPASLLSPAAAGLALATDVDSVLGTLVSQGLYWNLTDLGVVSTSSTPPAVSMLLFTTAMPPRTLTGYLTALGYTYVDSASAVHKNIVYASTAILGQYGVLMGNLDLSNAGALTSTQALTVANQILARYATMGLPWSAGFTLLPGQAYTLGGTKITDLATVTANVTVRVTNVTAAGDGTAQVVVPIGQVDYDDTAQSATLTPIATAQDGLLATIERANRIKVAQ